MSSTGKTFNAGYTLNAATANMLLLLLLLLPLLTSPLLSVTTPTTKSSSAGMYLQQQQQQFAMRARKCMHCSRQSTLGVDA
jgi:hypothetical protein